MFCSKCGKEIKEGAKFCGCCGTPVKAKNEDTYLGSKEAKNHNKKWVKNKRVIIGLVLLTLIIIGCGLFRAVKIKGDKIMTCLDGNPGVQIGDTYLEVGKATLQDFLDIGATLITTWYVEEPTYAMEPNEGKHINLVYNQTSLGLDVMNESNQLQAISKAIVYEINVEDGTDVCGPGGIRIGETIENLYKILGEPLELNTPNNKKFEYSYGTKQGDPSMYFAATRNKPDIISKFGVYAPEISIKSMKDVNDTIIQSMIAAYQKRQNESVFGIFETLENTGDAYGKSQGVVDGMLVGEPHWDKLLFCEVKDGVEAVDDTGHNFYPRGSCFLMATYTQNIEVDETTRNWFKKQYNKDVESSYTACGFVVFADPKYSQEYKKMKGATPPDNLYISEEYGLHTLLTGDNFSYDYIFPQSRTLDDYEITTIDLKKYN